MENARRYRAIASLCRQAAAFRPEQRTSLLRQAEEWERLAANELESACAPDACADEGPTGDAEIDASSEPGLRAEMQVDTRWWLPRREGLFAGLQA